MIKTYLIILLLITAFACDNNERNANNKRAISRAPSNSTSFNNDTAYFSYTKDLKSNRIPDSIFDMKELTVLSITGMDCDYGGDSCWAITELPPGIGNLTKLEQLSLTVNAIPTIPSSIQSLQQLRMLDLSDNIPLTDISALTALTKLESLSLFGCGITELPADIGKMKALKTLGLTGTHITSGELERVQKELPGCRIVYSR